MTEEEFVTRYATVSAELATAYQDRDAVLERVEDAEGSYRALQWEWVKSRPGMPYPHPPR